MPKIKIREQKWYGWRRSLPDFRDRRWMIPPHLTDERDLPILIDLKHNCPPVMDQGTLGSCVAHGVTAALRADRMHQSLPDIALSRLQLYYDGRVMEGCVNSDSGLEIRDGIKCAAKIGVADEKLWPYKIQKWRAKPSQRAYRDAKSNEALEYRSVALNTHDIKSALASGHPVVFGISVYESFETEAVTRTGVIPLPKDGEHQVGGHCMYLHGYDQNNAPDHAFGRNSWGTDWGGGGDFKIPWDYLVNPDLAADFWIVTTVGAGS